MFSHSVCLSVHHLIYLSQSVIMITFTLSLAGCVYKGRVYQENEQWDDGCDYQCACLDDMTGQYSCNERSVFLFPSSQLASKLDCCNNNSNQNSFLFLLLLLLMLLLVYVVLVALLLFLFLLLPQQLLLLLRRRQRLQLTMPLLRPLYLLFLLFFALLLLLLFSSFFFTFVFIVSF